MKAQIAAQLRRRGVTARVAVSTSPAMTTPTWYPVDPDWAGRIMVEAVGLSPATTYHTAVEVDGVLDTAQRCVFTTPSASPAAFSFLAGSCQETGTDHPVFDRMAEHDTDFFLHLGDIHYADIDTPEARRFREAGQASFGSPSFSALVRSQPFVYVWDDHDYGPNNSGQSAPGRLRALDWYQRTIPAYDRSSEQHIGQTFAWNGLVRFVVPDVRAQRSGTSILGADQLQWVQDTMTDADEPFICWCPMVPWTAGGSDSWAGASWSGERTILGDFFVNEGLSTRMFGVTADTHMLAIDDGSNNDWGGFPHLLAAPFRQGTADRAGVADGYSIEPVPFLGSGVVSQFGKVTCTPDGDDLDVTFEGFAVDDAGVETSVMTHTFTLAG